MTRWVDFSDPVFLALCAALALALLWFVSVRPTLRRREAQVQLARANKDFELVAKYSSFDDERQSRLARLTLNGQKEIADHAATLEMGRRSHEVDTMVEAANEANLAGLREAQAMEADIRRVIRDLHELEKEASADPAQEELLKWTRKLLETKMKNYDERFGR
jgi:hypothetical protein